MTDLNLASMDFTAGLKVNNLTVQPIVIDVVYPNASANLVKAVKSEKIIVQKMQMAILEGLKKAKNDFHSAVKELDATYDEKPPSSEKEAEERAKTFNTVWKQIAEAQKGVAIKVAQAEWNNQKKKNKALAEYDGMFAVRLSLGVIGVGASITHTIMSFGASSAFAIASIARSCYGMAADIDNHCREMAKTEQDIIKADDAMANTWADDKKTAGKIGRELAAALGVPFVKSVAGMGTLLTEYDGKNARRDKSADALYKKAQELMKKIEEISPKAGPEMKKKLNELAKKTDELLSSVHDISASSKDCDKFSDTYRKRYDTYKAFQGKALSVTGKATPVAMLAAGAVSNADTIVKIAMSLA